MNQARLHDRIVKAAGVKLDRAGAALLYMLRAHGDSPVTGLAELLGVDAPTVTRKVQQLEREGLVVRHGDTEDRRVSRIRLTPLGWNTLDKVLKARHTWFARIFAGWDEAELTTFAAMLGRFASAVEHDLEDAHCAGRR
jgi:DNA-binding MarR family transcriptional regulator